MKKLILILVACCLCSCAAQTATLPEENVKKSSVEDAAKPSKQVVTITAVGDCTLATDDAAVADDSFVSMVEEQDDYTYFFENVADIFEEDDLTIVNFEGTLSKRGTRQDKQFAFRGDPDYVEILTSSSVEAASLANNHSSDYGKESYDDTIKYLEDAGIAVVDGTKVEIMEINGVTVGLVGIYALNETRAAELDEAMEKVKKEGAELIIVSAHWGEERAKTPNSFQKELAHKAVDLGADLVVGHHPHVIQGIEKYNGKYIVYSLGNFCFGGNRNPTDKDTMIFRQTFTLKNGEPEDDDDILIIPCSISSDPERNNYQPTPLEDEEADRVTEKIAERTRAIFK